MTTTHHFHPLCAGTGILLAVTIIYSYWEMYDREKQQGFGGM